MPFATAPAISILGFGNSFGIRISSFVISKIRVNPCSSVVSLLDRRHLFPTQDIVLVRAALRPRLLVIIRHFIWPESPDHHLAGDFLSIQRIIKWVPALVLIVDVNRNDVRVSERVPYDSIV